MPDYSWKHIVMCLVSHDIYNDVIFVCYSGMLERDKEEELNHFVNGLPLISTYVE